MLIADADLTPASKQFLNANLRVLDICITRPSRSYIDATQSPCRVCVLLVSTRRGAYARVCVLHVLTRRGTHVRVRVLLVL